MYPSSRHFSTNTSDAQTRGRLIVKNGESVSSNGDSMGARGLALEFPATWTAADLLLEVYDEGARTWKRLVQADGTPVRISGIAANTVAVAPDAAAAIGAYPRFRVVSVTVGNTTAVNQAADRTIFYHPLF